MTGLHTLIHLPLYANMDFGDRFKICSDFLKQMTTD